jgi:hypothetical protein
MTTNIERGKALRDQGIAALRIGKMVEAQELLAQSVELNPDDEHAWLWLSATAETAEDKRFCLEKVLALNPASDAARKGLAKLPSPAAAPAAPPAVAPPPALSLPPAFPPATSRTIPLGPPPAPGASPSSYQVPEDITTYKRPGCVTCLASCSFIFGLFSLVTIVVFANIIKQVAQEIDFSDSSVNIPTAFLSVIGIIFGLIALIYFVMGFGLWTGKRFAWWLTILYFGYTIITEVFGAVDLIIHSAEFQAVLEGSGLRNFKAVFAGGIIMALVISAFSALVITMLFIPDTLGFFKLSRVNKGRALTIVFGLSLLLGLCGFRFSSGAISRAALQQMGNGPGGGQQFDPER